MACAIRDSGKGLIKDSASTRDGATTRCGGRWTTYSPHLSPRFRNESGFSEGLGFAWGTIALRVRRIVTQAMVLSDLTRMTRHTILIKRLLYISVNTHDLRRRVMTGNDFYQRVRKLSVHEFQESLVYLVVFCLFSDANGVVILSDFFQRLPF